MLDAGGLRTERAGYGSRSVVGMQIGDQPLRLHAIELREAGRLRQVRRLPDADLLRDLALAELDGGDDPPSPHTSYQGMNPL